MDPIGNIFTLAINIQTSIQVLFLFDTKKLFLFIFSSFISLTKFLFYILGQICPIICCVTCEIVVYKYFNLSTRKNRSSPTTLCSLLTASSFTANNKPRPSKKRRPEIQCALTGSESDFLVEFG